MTKAPEATNANQADDGDWAVDWDIAQRLIEIGEMSSPAHHARLELGVLLGNPESIRLPEGLATQLRLPVDAKRHHWMTPPPVAIWPRLPTGRPRAMTGINLLVRQAFDVCMQCRHTDTPPGSGLCDECRSALSKEERADIRNRLRRARQENVALLEELTAAIDELRRQRPTVKKTCSRCGAKLRSGNAYSLCAPCSAV